MNKSLRLSLCIALLTLGAGFSLRGQLHNAWVELEYRFNPAHHAHEFAHRGESEEEEEEFEKGGDSGRKPQADGPQEANEREYLMTRDPQTRTVPTERLYAAMEYYAARQHETSSNSRFARKASLGLGSISWTERGANNIGGRTRAILFDKSDTSGKTVFAGAVGGGLWKTTNITAATPSWSPVNDQFANMAITAIAQNPTTPGIIYFGTGEGYYNGDAIKGGGIWKSIDGGATFTRLSSTNNDNFAYVQKIAVAANGDVYAACRGGVYCNTGGLQKSTDGGATWTTVIGSGTACASAVDYRVTDVEIAANGDIYAATGIFTAGHIYRSSMAANGTATGDVNTWTNITPAGSFYRIEIACAPNDSNQIYALCQGSGSYDVTGIFSSSNQGASWTSRSIPTIIDQGANSTFTRGQAWYDLTCAVDPTNSQTLYIGGVDLLRSTNAGASFTQITTWSLYSAPGFTSNQNTHADIHTFMFRPNHADCALFGCDGGLEYSSNLTNSLPTWVTKNTGYNVTQYYSVAPSPTNANYYLAGAQDNGTQKFTSPGVNSVTTATGGDGGQCWIDKTNANNQIAAYVYNNYYVSTNGGTSFSTVSGGTNTGMFVNAGDLDGTNDILYTGGGGDQLVRWTNMFTTPTRTNLVVSLSGAQATSIKVSPNTPSTVYVGTGYGNVFRVTNASGTPSVTQIASGLGGYVASIDVWKKASGLDDSILVALSDYGVNSVYVTGNGSSSTPTWVSLDDHNTLQDIPVRSAIFDVDNPRSIYLATEVGVLATDLQNGAATTWTMINNGTLPMVRIDQLRFNSQNQLVVATHGRGLFTTNSFTALPIRVTTFTAAKTGDHANLHWTLGIADAAGHYTIERMYEGENTFSTVATIEAQGMALEYNTTDAPDWTRGAVFYRLRSEDGNGAVSYSNVEKIAGTAGHESFFTALFPTITQDEVTLAAGNIGAALIDIVVHDANGKVVMHQSGPYMTTSLHLGALPAGSYFISVADDRRQHLFTGRVIRQ